MAPEILTMKILMQQNQEIKKQQISWNRFNIRWAFEKTSDTLLPVLKNLLNLVFEHGAVPEKWTTCIIKSIYKNKGPQAIIDL